MTPDRRKPGSKKQSNADKPAEATQRSPQSPLHWLAPAAAQFKALEADAANEGRFKQVVKALKYLQLNPRHPSLNTHAYDDPAIVGSAGEKVFEAYAQNQTPGAYRIFWCYGPDRGQITIIAITGHPND